MAKSRRAPDEDVRRRPADDEDDTPRRKGRRTDDDEPDDDPIKPRRKKKSAAGPTKIVLRIIGGVLGATALIVFLVWVYSPVGTDHSMLCYLPKETIEIQGYDVDEVMKNAKMSEVNQTIMSNFKAMGDRRWGGEATGVKDTDVLRYLHGQASGDAEEEKDLPPQQRRGELTVIRFKRDVDEAKFVGSYPNQAGYQCEEQQAKDGRKFYQLWTKKRVPPDWHEEREDDVSFFFPTKTTLVYGSTRRELTEAMTRTPGKVVLEGTIKELSDKVDGHYFTARTGWFEKNGISNSMAFGLGFTGDDFKDQRKFTGVVGNASWFASNGNDFLYASANLYGDSRTARDVRKKLAAAYEKAQEQIWQSESGKPSGLVDPFNPPQEKGAQAGGPGMGMPMAPSGSSEQTADIIAALAEYTRSARVYNRGKLVIVEGLIPHGTPEQGIFEKFWHAISGKFSAQGMGGMPGMMPGMMPGGGQMMPPGGAPMMPPGGPGMPGPGPMPPRPGG